MADEAMDERDPRNHRDTASGALEGQGGGDFPGAGYDRSLGDRSTGGEAARDALGTDPEADEQMRRATGSQPAGGISEEPDASPTGFADTGRVGGFSRPTTSVAGTTAPDVPGTPHRWDEREHPPAIEED